MSTISSRRFFIAAVLLVTAVAGAALRSFSAHQSAAYYLGTLLMVLWIPIVGNIIAFVVKKLRPVAQAPSSFSTPFVPHARVELHLLAEQGFEPPRVEQDGSIHGLFIVGTEGFSVRISLPGPRSAQEPLGAEVQFLFPEAALPKFPVGSAFKLMQGQAGFGTGRVLSLSSAA